MNCFMTYGIVIPRIMSLKSYFLNIKLDLNLIEVGIRKASF